ncbi:hypothetical protein PENSPDRAFT_156568 [Peniophora sp. CONT]|nr:hypothetical protein PENSPDRAFT_156568 [Peniophora sp. CONT]
MVIMSTWGQELYKPVKASDRATHPRIPGGLNDELWTSIDIMWMSLWDRRSSLARISTLPKWGPVSIAFDMIAWATMELRKRIHPHTNSHPVTVRVAYFVWVYVHGYERLTERDVVSIPAHHFAPTLLYDHCEFLRKTNNGNSAMSESQTFMEELLKSLDHRTLIRAAHNTLKFSVKLVDEYLVAYLRVLAIQMKLIGLHWYSTPPFLEAFTRAVARQTTHSNDLRSGPGIRTQYEMKVYGAVLEHIQIMIPGLKSGSIPSASFHGHRFWDIMLGGLLPAYSADSLLRHEQGRCLCADHEALAEGLTTFLGQLVSLTNAFASEIHNGRLPRTVIDEVREAGMSPRMQVTGIWYDEIRSMRMVLRHNPTWATYTTALEAWLKLGDAFGIDETSQRDLEAAQRARQCSWRVCAFHMTPSEKPLLVCKGCKEARYCSAACQRSDWKQGGHRTECRRVK